MGWFHWDGHGKKVKEPKTKLIRALPGGVNWPEWSPDRRYIAIVTEGVLSLVAVETTSVTGQWFPQGNEPPCQKIEEWSLDGKHILFYVGGNVCAAAVAGVQIKEITNLSMGNGRDATWSPDGKHVAFVSRRGGGRNYEIYMVEIESGHTKRITYTNYNHFDLDWR
jgi:Tol biopolymer transport system component